MTRREALINAGRILLLRWRVIRGRALPAIAMAVLSALDRLAARWQERGR